MVRDHFPPGDPGEAPTGVLTASCEAVTCAGGANSNCPCTSAANPGCGAGVDPNAVGTNNELQVQYNCYVAMNYWDEPTTSDGSPTIDDFWTITARIEDTSGTSIVATSTSLGGDIACTGINDCDVIDHQSTRLLDVTGPVSWTAVSLGVGNDPADGASDLALHSRANDDVPSVTVTGADLLGVDPTTSGAVSSSILRVGAFSVDENTNEVAVPPTECDPVSSQILDDNAAVTVAGVAVPFTAGGAGDIGTVDNDNVYFCIREILSGSTCTVLDVINQDCSPGADSASYRAATDSGVTPPFANPWDLTQVP